MKKLKKSIASLALVAVLSMGVVWGGSGDQSNHSAIASDPVFIQKPGHVAMVSTTPEIVASAAKQLDATSQSGGPTAAQNQKIQEAV